MGDEEENVIGVFMVFLVVAIAGWKMLDTEIARPLGVGWLIIGILGAFAIIMLLIAKIMREV